MLYSQDEMAHSPHRRSDVSFADEPRSFDAPWPSELASDRALRTFFETTHDDDPPAVIKAKAKEQLDIDLDQL